jgi:outer membrane protein assembly factor BamB
MQENRPLPTVGQLVFVGLNGWVAALDRDSGEIVWKCNELKSGYTTLLLDGDRLLVSTNGYLYCPDPQTGRVVWSNALRGLGTGVAHLVSARGQSSPVSVTQAAAVAAERAAHGAHAAGS